MARLSVGTAAAMMAGVAITATAPAAVLPAPMVAPVVQVTVPAVQVAVPTIAITVPVVAIKAPAQPAVPMLDPHTELMCGWMTKEGLIPNIFLGFKKSWKKRYFRLTYLTLDYFEDEAMHKQKGEVKGKWIKDVIDIKDGAVDGYNYIINLDCAKKQKDADYETSGKKTTVKRMYKLCVDGTEGEKQQWISAFKTVRDYHMHRKAKKMK